MTDSFTQLLQDKDVLLADGATGTNLFNMGLQSGDAPELWNTDEPQKIMALYQGSVNAGSDLFLTNSFGGTAARLKLHDAQTRVRELNRIAAELGREVVDKAGRKIAVAGSVGPTGEILQPVGELSHELAVEMFHEQADALKEGGADVLWLETISAPEEFRAAAEAFKLADMPWCGTMSFDTAGRTMMGVTSADLAKLVEEFDNAPLAFGANCGTGASDILRTVLGFVAQGTERPIISKGNAGIPKYVDGHIHYDGTPELMGEYAVMARDCGAKIIGGCCGTMPDHLRHMRDALDSRPRGERPTLDRIVEVLGPFTSASDGTGEDAAAGERRSRRGRRRG
ncbi:betaine--homocysteine S-methyltransferase [Phaeobacter sp. QD34_3]|uniref:betaine--homocysteine S-methyltransferase n=1 Tax=unclassified Phaeobacter TaxID=2621772 RepID=UPI00237F4B87|nr:MULTISPECIES: betaine--homocysteine S-methyltransferase [unclassified Phaeobacter]MDE4131557.1 betaine--homocysteine S-methyltransferase [Phaeobacter sp. QD34_3]MDE4135354.1 betaine--homocysteine S-methyltransferase [Phaeobacter sp. QD34_24]